MADRTEYNRMQKAKRRAEMRTADLNADIADKFADISQRADKPADRLPNADMFIGKGRGVPVNGFVLIGHADGDYVVTETAWHTRLHSGCSHLPGWQCKSCH